MREDDCSKNEQCFGTHLPMESQTSGLHKCYMCVDRPQLSIVLIKCLRDSISPHGVSSQRCNAHKSLLIELLIHCLLNCLYIAYCITHGVTSQSLMHIHCLSAKLTTTAPYKSCAMYSAPCTTGRLRIRNTCAQYNKSEAQH